MEKLFSKSSVIFTCLLSVISFLFGDADKLLIALSIFVALDICTGILKAFITKTVNSEISYTGIAKKVFIFVMVSVAYWSQLVIGDALPIRNIVICFYFANEGISILENCAEFIPIPKKLKDTLTQLRKKGDE